MDLALVRDRPLLLREDQAPLFRTIGILTRADDRRVVRVLDALLPWLEGQGKDVLFRRAAFPRSCDPGAGLPKLPARPDLLLALGGDATVLAAAKLAAEGGVPVLGVNLGRLGFLAELAADEVYTAFERIFRGDFAVEELPLLSASIRSRGGAVTSSLALNDIVLTKGAFPRSIELRVELDARFELSVHGDGLIVATPTGSTAYSLAAGGPIVTPSIEALIITPICAHALTRQPIVVPCHSEVAIELKSRFGDAQAAFDGQPAGVLERGSRVTISTSGARARFLRLPGQSYYERLRRKLSWGRG